MDDPIPFAVEEAAFFLQGQLIFVCHEANYTRVSIKGKPRRKTRFF
jgi:hypothetical protein